MEFKQAFARIAFLGLTLLCGLPICGQQTVPNRTFTSFRWPTKESRGCLVVQDESTLNRELDKIRWGRYNEPRPSMDWHESVAIVIAPQDYPNEGLISLDSLSVENSTLKLRWRFRTTTANNKSTPGGSISFGGGNYGPQILVVEVAASELSKFSLSCYQQPTR